MRTLTKVALLLLLMATPAHAAGDGLLFPTINFVILFVTLFILLRKPVGTYFETRRGAIRTDLEEAAKLKSDAEAHFARWQRKLDDLQDELDGIRNMSRERADAERESLLEDARRSADRIRQDAAAAVDQEVRRARATLHDEASKLAVELAAGILREQVTEQDRDRLLEEFIGRIESAPSAGNQA